MTTTLESQRLTVDACRAALKTVIDPEIFQNIIDLGLVYEIEINPDNAVTVTMTLTTPHCPMGPQIIEDVENTLKNSGASAANVNIVWNPPWTPYAMTEELQRQLGIIDQEEPVEEEMETLPPPPPDPPKKRGFLRRMLRL
jgi:metal-sulfur cluster biosynthetic enzyme